MVVGELLTPEADAVTSAVPAGPGVQTIGFDKESHFPAQAIPEFEIVRTSGLLEANAIVNPLVMVPPDASRTEAAKLMREPISIELCPEGASVTTAGTVGGFGVLLELVLPQATSMDREAIRVMRHTAEPQRPMNPPRARSNALREHVCSGKLSV